MFSRSLILYLTLLLAPVMAACAATPPGVVLPPTTSTSIPSAPTPRTQSPVVSIATPLQTAVGAAATVAISPTIPVYTYRIVRTYPHDPAAFTQGLVFTNGILYEGTGLQGQSSLRRVQLETGTVLQRYDLAPEYFGEGVALFADRLYQLTWQSQVGFVYDQATFETLRTFNYPTEGWGLTNDERQLIMSDGTATLHFLDPETLTETGRVEVQAAGQPVPSLNELEWVEGEIFANIWTTDRIARINPQTGAVVGWIDLTGLLDSTQLIQPVDVLNGIAYDDATDRLFVTGKLWPTLFEVELVPVTP